MNKFLLLLLALIIFSFCTENNKQSKQTHQPPQQDTTIKPFVVPDTHKIITILQLDTLWCLNCIAKLATESTELEAYKFMYNQENMGDTLKQCLDLSYSFDSTTTVKYIVLLLLKYNLQDVLGVGYGASDIRICKSFASKRIVNNSCPIPYYFFKYFNIPADSVEIAPSSIAYGYVKKDKKILKYKPIITIMKKIDKAEIEYKRKHG